MVISYKLNLYYNDGNKLVTYYHRPLLTGLAGTSQIAISGLWMALKRGTAQDTDSTTNR